MAAARRQLNATAIQDKFGISEDCLVRDGTYALDAGGSSGSKRGRYGFEASNGEILASEGDGRLAPLCTFSAATGDRLGIGPISTDIFESLADKELPSIGVCDSEIIGEIQDEDGANAVFVLPSQLNGAEYPSHASVVDKIEEYKYDNTGGPRGQLAVHPAPGQWVLDNAAHDGRPPRPGGLNAVDVVLSQTHAQLDSLGITARFALVNGYMHIPQPGSQEMADKIVGAFRSNVHNLRVLFMRDIPATGLNPGKSAFSEAGHSVSLVYASAVPVQTYLNDGLRPMADLTPDSLKRYQEQIAEAVLVVQYLGACKSAVRAGKSKVYFMPLGGGVFCNPWTSIVKAMALAMELLAPEELRLLDVQALAFNRGTADDGTKEAKKLKELLQAKRKFKKERKR